MARGARRDLFHRGVRTGAALSLLVAAVWVGLLYFRATTPDRARGLEAGMMLLSGVLAVPLSLVVFPLLERVGFPRFVTPAVILLLPLANGALLGAAADRVAALFRGRRAS